MGGRRWKKKKGFDFGTFFYASTVVIVLQEEGTEDRRVLRLPMFSSWGLSVVHNFACSFGLCRVFLQQISFCSCLSFCEIRVVILEIETLATIRVEEQGN